MNNDRKIFLLNFFQPMDIDKKYAGILEKKWTSVIRLQKKVSLKQTVIGRTMLCSKVNFALYTVVFIVNF